MPRLAFLRFVSDNSVLRRCFSSRQIEFGLLGEADRMLWTIFAILIILWLLGWGFHIAGSLIHLLLVLALIVVVINLVTGRRTV